MLRALTVATRTRRPAAHLNGKRFDQVYHTTNSTYRKTMNQIAGRCRNPFGTILPYDFLFVTIIIVYSIEIKILSWF
jgi:hypothetical protein